MIPSQPPATRAASSPRAAAANPCLAIACACKRNPTLVVRHTQEERRRGESRERRKKKFRGITVSLLLRLLSEAR